MYWPSTLLVTAALLLSAGSYFLSQSMIVGLREIGFPDFFRIQLGAMQAVGALVLVAPNVPQPLREWAYAGVGLFFITSIVAHLAHKDPFVLTLLNVGLLALLAISRYSLDSRL